jgi:hypothetical protein
MRALPHRVTLSGNSTVVDRENNWKDTASILIPILEHEET